MASIGGTFNNFPGTLVQRTSAKVRSPEGEAQQTPTADSGFGNQTLSGQSRINDLPSTIVLKEKQAVFVVHEDRPTNGEKRKLPPDYSDSIQVDVFRKKRPTKVSETDISAAEKGTQEQSERENAGAALEEAIEDSLSHKGTKDDDTNGKKELYIVEDQIIEGTTEGEDPPSHEDAWKAFVANIEKKDYPKLEEYLQAKESRLVQQTKFQNALGAFIASLNVFGKGMVEETSRGACAKRNKKMKAMQDNITEILVSNHARRNTCIDQLYEADRLWKTQYEDLTSSLLTGTSNSADFNAEKSGEEMAQDGAKNSREGTKERKTSNDEKLSPGDASPPKEARDDEEADWTAICEFQPAQASVAAFLGAKDDFDCAMTNANQLQNEIEEDVTREITGLIEKMQEMVAKLEGRIADLEIDVETHIMNNHDRRADQQERVQVSAQKAQSLFSDLLSGLLQSMR